MNGACRPEAVLRVDKLGVSKGRESRWSVPGTFGAPEPQDSRAGQRSFVQAGDRSSADLAFTNLTPEEQPPNLLPHELSERRRQLRGSIAQGHLAMKHRL